MVKKILRKINLVMEGRIGWFTEETGSKDTNQGGCFLKCGFEVLMLKLESSGKNGNFDALLNHEGLSLPLDVITI